jgi:hypothetical protein
MAAGMAGTEAFYLRDLSRAAAGSTAGGEDGD